MSERFRDARGIRPQQAAVLGPERHQFTRRIGNDDHALIDGGAGAAQKGRGLGDARMIPKLLARVGVQGEGAIVQGDHEDPAAAHRGGGMHGAAQHRAPHFLARGRVQGDDMAEPGRGIDLPALGGHAAGQQAVVGLGLGGQCDIPDDLAGLHVDGIDLGFGIHGEDAPSGGNGRAENAQFVIDALADVGAPGLGDVFRHQDVVHGMVRIAARLRPIGIGRGGGQQNLVAFQIVIGSQGPLIGQDRDAGPRQGNLFLGKQIGEIGTAADGHGRRQSKGDGQDHAPGRTAPTGPQAPFRAISAIRRSHTDCSPVPRDPF